MYIFGSSTPRSGGTLISNLLSMHPDVLITHDLLHFFRYIYKKYDPLNFKNLTLLVNELVIRIKYRNDILLDPKKILQFLPHNKEIYHYSDIIKMLYNYVGFVNNKKIIGEIANFEWFNIENFLDLNEDFKAFQIIRDPRAIIASFKNITYEKNHNYLAIIFYWLDAVHYSEKLSNNKNYFVTQFEEVHQNPELVSKSIFNFLNLDFDKSILDNSEWEKRLNTKFNFINSSGHDNKKKYGFDPQRSHAWKNKLEKWEVALITFLLEDYLRKYNYEVLDYKKEDVEDGIKVLKNNELLKKMYNNYLDNGRGTHHRERDPSNPENWAAKDITKNVKAKFIDTDDYKLYSLEIKKIRENYGS